MTRKLTDAKILKNRLNVIEEICSEDHQWLFDQLCEQSFINSMHMPIAMDPLDSTLNPAFKYALQSAPDKERWIHRLDQVINRWRTRKSRERNKKKVVSLDLTTEARNMLRKMATAKEISQSAFIEKLIHQAGRRYEQSQSKTQTKKDTYGPQPPKIQGLATIAEQNQLNEP